MRGSIRAFDGHFVFSLKLIEDLGLETLVETEAVLAGREQRSRLRRLLRIWTGFGELIPVQVVANEGQFPLLGTALLEKCKLTVDYVSKTVELGFSRITGRVFTEVAANNKQGNKKTDHLPLRCNPWLSENETNVGRSRRRWATCARVTPSITAGVVSESERFAGTAFEAVRVNWIGTRWTTESNPRESGNLYAGTAIRT